MSNVSKYFGFGSNKIYALKNINLSINKGDFVAIMGQSGSGKSTLMNILGCLDSSSSGSYKVNGVEVIDMTKDEQAELRCKTFGFIFQKYNLLTSLSALENIALPCVYYGLENKTRVEKAESLLSDFGLENRSKNRPNELSGGQQQRVSIARALINGGEIILADEPTGALDSKSGEIVMEIIKKLHEKGHTVILVTHDQNIASYANRIIEIKDGEIISDITKSGVLYEKREEKPTKKKSKFDYFRYQFYESFKMSLKAIKTHKMRSLLTMLGIIIGIASVVSVVALGNGSKEKIMMNLNSIGSNTIMVLPGEGFGDKEANKIKTLKISDADIFSKLSYVDSVSPNIAAQGLLIYKNKSVISSLDGVSAEFLEVNNKELQKGRRFNISEVKNAAAVAIIDQNTQKEIFGKADAIGEVIMFNKQPLRIIGIMAQEDNFGPPNLNLRIYTPYTTAMYKVLGNQEIAGITVKISDNVNSHLAEDDLIKVLTAIHGKKDFFTINSDSIRKMVEDITNTMTLLVSSIAVIALVVGGIGVMNIMLVSVTERTKEIGIRMAIGAKRKNILQQFLIEAVLLCLIGGAVGILFTMLFGFIFNNFIDDFKMILSLDAVLIALFFSMAIGILFGYMPARNASNLNPIEALARE
ncbi:MAG: MacB family efflux pump subunit [Campylobacteraceae bacterium]|jgi:macrolide transport system ATP-binding/permease protein|nr:MacB family efflux pump subunit [Campylobacteraceae bacterium]